MPYRICITDDGCHRSFHLMGKVSNKLITALNHILQFFHVIFHGTCHGIEVAGQLAYFIIRLHICTYCIISTGYLSGDLIQFFKRSCKEICNDIHDKCRQKKHCHRNGFKELQIVTELGINTGYVLTCNDI